MSATQFGQFQIPVIQKYKNEWMNEETSIFTYIKIRPVMMP